MRSLLTYSMLFVLLGPTFAEDADTNLAWQLRRAKTQSEVQLQEYLNRSRLDSDSDDHLGADALLSKLKKQIRRELELDLAVQKDRIASAEARLATTKKRINASAASIDTLVDQELALRLDSAEPDKKQTEAKSNVEGHFETPSALLAHFDKASVNGTADLDSLIEQMTDNCVQEMAGVMLQQIAFMSALGQLGAQTGGFLGSSDGTPLVSPMGPSLMAAQCLEKHVLNERPPASEQAFQLLAQSSINQAFSDEVSIAEIDHSVYQIAAGVLKSPREFLREASKVMDSWSDETDDTNPDSSEEPKKHQWLISAAEDSAIAVDHAQVDDPPVELRLKRIEGRWMIDRMISDEMLTQISTSYRGIKTSDSETSDLRLSSASPPAIATTLEIYEVGGIVSNQLFQATHERAGLDQKRGQTSQQKLQDGCSDLMVLLQDSLRLHMESCVFTPDKLALMIRHSETGHQEIKTILHRLGGDLDRRIRLEVALVEEDDLPPSIANQSFGPRPKDRKTLDEIWEKLDEGAEVFLQSIDARQGEIVELSFGAGSKIRLVSRWEPNHRKLQLRFDEDLFLDPSRILSHVVSLNSGDTNVQILSSEGSYRWLIRATLISDEPPTQE